MSRPLPVLALLKFEYVFDFFDRSMFEAWPETVKTVTFEWDDDGSRFAEAVRVSGAELIVGNIPATAYDRIVAAARELPGVRFWPSLALQRLNRSKEEVVRFCREHTIAHPATEIFHDRTSALAWLATSRYPKVIRRSYGASNFGSYHSRLVASAEEAEAYLKERGYDEVLVQDAVTLRHGAEFRVILMDHTVQAHYWHRDGSAEPLKIDEAPEAALELAVSVSRVLDAPYLICSVAVDDVTGAALLLECATGFAAAPELRAKIAAHLIAVQCQLQE
jgi:hypothetical protein